MIVWHLILWAAALLALGRGLHMALAVGWAIREVAGHPREAELGRFLLRMMLQSAGLIMIGALLTRVA